MVAGLLVPQVKPQLEMPTSHIRGPNLSPSSSASRLEIAHDGPGAWIQAIHVQGPEGVLGAWL